MGFHTYNINQKLLCFEPDTSKAKVLYLAKILKHVQKTSEVPYYIVHFQGWKGKWDREVPENLLLENTEFNRKLKSKIDQIAHKTRCRFKRKRLIDSILEIASISGDDIDWDKVPSVRNPPRRFLFRPIEQKDGEQVNQQQAVSDSMAIGDYTDYANESVLSTLDDEESMQSEYENLPLHRLFIVPINLPPNLRKIMQAEETTLSTTHAASNWCSVLQLIQSYVDGFPYTMPSATLIKNQESCPSRAWRALGSVYAQRDKNRTLCADVCSSLRVLFDTMLESIVLKPNEMHSLTSRNHSFLNNGGAFSPGITSPPEVQSEYRYASPRFELLPTSEALIMPTLPCLIYPAHLLLRLCAQLPNLLNTLHLSLSRQAIVTRHLCLFFEYLDRTRKFWLQTLTVPTSIALNCQYPETTEMPQKSIEHVASKHPSESSSSTEPLVHPNESQSKRRATQTRKPTSTSIPSIIIDLPIVIGSRPEPLSNLMSNRPRHGQSGISPPKRRSMEDHTAKRLLRAARRSVQSSLSPRKSHSRSSDVASRSRKLNNKGALAPIGGIQQSSPRSLRNSVSHNGSSDSGRSVSIRSRSGTTVRGRVLRPR